MSNFEKRSHRPATTIKSNSEHLSIQDDHKNEASLAPPPFQMKSVEEEEQVQMKKGTENKTGMPDHLKSGIENLSGMDMSDVNVHYNSAEPSQFNALAYAQGNNIHLGAGQEKHLPHEAWHVAQQKQGRVKATTSMGGAGINDDVSLEREADVMGDRASKQQSTGAAADALEKKELKDSPLQAKGIVQRKKHTGINIGHGGGVFFDDDSHFDVNTTANITTNAGKTMSMALPHGRTSTIDGKRIQDGSNGGSITVNSPFEVFQDNNWVNETKKGSFTSQYNYSVSPSGLVTIYNNAQGEDFPSVDKYRVLANSNTDTESINHTLAVNEPHTHGSTTTTTKEQKSSSFNAGIGANFNPQMHAKLSLHLEANGDDVLMLIGGAKIAKKGLKALKNIKWLQKILGDFTELLKKQKVEIDLTPEVKAGLEANFGYKYSSASQTSTDTVEKQSYKLGGVHAKEVNKLKVLQNLIGATEVYYEKPGASTLSSESKASIDQFLLKNHLILQKLKVPNSPYKIFIEGHTSQTQPAEKNMQLGKNRADLVKAYIQSKYDFINFSHFSTTTSHGETHSKSSISEDASDRRVGITIKKIR